MGSLRKYSYNLRGRNPAGFAAHVEKREVEGFPLRRPLPGGPQMLVQGGAPADTRPEMPHEQFAWLSGTSCVPP